MKLKTIASLFNRNKRLIIYTDSDSGGEQWISNGHAIYRLSGLPHMTAEAMLKIFDVPEDKRTKWHCEESELPTSVINFEDYEHGEVETTPLRISIGVFGTGYRFFVDGKRIHSIDDDYINPLRDDPTYLSFHKRETVKGGFVLACKVGLELKAIILPRPLNDNDVFTEDINKIARLYEMMKFDVLTSAVYELLEKEDADIKSEVDPETGEITERQMSLHVVPASEDGSGEE